MNDLMLFIDGSVSSKSNIGFGAYLSVPYNEISLYSPETHVKLKRFENTSSTKLELQTLLWAINDIQASGKKILIYTDSQNIISLLKRCDRLKQNNYYSKKKIRLKNYELYQEFYAQIEELNCEFIKVQGHKVLSNKDYIDRFFTVVDRASRKALRDDMSNYHDNTDLK
jgi:ribonuclease HI